MHAPVRQVRHFILVNLVIEPDESATHHASYAAAHVSFTFRYVHVKKRVTGH